MLSLILAQSGSSFGSKTTHFVPRKSDSSRKRARRRMGMYFHSEPMSSEPSSVREPQLTMPLGNLRRQLTPSLFSTPFSMSVRLTSKSSTPNNAASVPAGAFQTPREESLG